MTTKRVAWITGAGKGIGRALALRLADEGYRIAASARTAKDLRTLVDEGPPDAIHAYPLDVTDLAATEQTLEQIEHEHGPVGLAVLNAGTHIPTPAAGFSSEEFRKLVEVNLMGTAIGFETLVPKLIARRSGRIAVVASVAGYRGLPTAGGYGATKAGLINFCEAMRPELEAHGITLQVINPGFVETPLTDQNDFPMPFLVSAEVAADRIAHGLQQNAFEIAFPMRFVAAMKCLRILPDRLYFALARRMMPR